MKSNNTKLRPYQREAVKKLAANNKLCLFAKPGLGKTLIMLQHLKNLFDAGEIKNVLIVSTLRIIHQVWPAEARKWGFDFITSIVHGTPKQRLAALDRPAEIYLINFDGLVWLDEQGILFDALVIDEVTFLKNTTSRRFKAIKNDLPSYNHRYSMTGSPLTRNYEDLFGMMYVVADQVLGRNITYYRNNYFTQGSTHWQRWVKPSAKAIIAQLIAPYVHVIPLEGNVDLPDITYNDVFVDLPDAARKIYNDLKINFVAELKEKKLAAVHQAAAANKLQQIANGAVYTRSMLDLDAAQTSDEWEVVHDAKIDATMELIETIGDPVLIAYNFKHDLKRLSAALDAAKLKYMYLGGGVSAKVANQAIESWTRGELDVLLLHPASGGHGLNLQSGPGHDVIWFSLPYSYDKYEQTNARLQRSGQKNKVVVHHILADSTIDLTVKKLLGRNEAQQNEFVDLVVKAMLDDLKIFGAASDDGTGGA